MSRRGSSGWLFWGSLGVALLLALAPLPALLQWLKPYLPALVLLYWILEEPEGVALSFAFMLGLAADVLFGTLIGEQAMRLTIIAFIAGRFRARIRFFPLWQQAAAVLVLLLNDRVVVLAIRSLSGEGWPPAAFWLAPFVAMLLWPWLFLLMDTLSQWRRAR